MKECSRCGETGNGFYTQVTRICKKCAKIYAKNYKKTDKAKAYKKEYEKRPSSKLKKIIYRREYEKRPGFKLKRAEYRKNRRASDVQYKLNVSLRRRFYNALRNGNKRGSAVKDLGCTVPDLKLYLESKFLPGMSWKNYGKWHIDHIVPLSKFDLRDRDQFLKACHYTNLQPLWAKENIMKSNK